MKIVCYGVRPIEEPYFKKLNKDHFDLKLVSAFLTNDNGDEAEGMDAVLVRGNCAVNEKNLNLFASYGINYVFTRSVGFNHIDLKTAKQLGIQIARVPNYSPYAVAELAMTLGMQMFRHVNLAINDSRQGDFTVKPTLFSREVHSSTVGIIGAGKIGLTEAKLYHGMGAHVLAFDPHPYEAAKQYVDFVGMDELLAKSDIVSIHVPYFPGKNDNMINADTFKQMKDSAIFVNTARGEIVDTRAVIDAIKDQQIAGYATDVVIDEKQIMNKQFPSLDYLPNADVKEMAKLYPRVVITPHMGSFTEPALEDMISISFDNFAETLKTGTNPNVIEYKG
ncbi:NAD(P)-dependent oxidoreductase [Limosilactobacillus pontis]|uniref:NAD(P)-dependent oxidoreductase n=1 Tax=Limosilactobacillus pontis TaxID=35787 RepID=UPI002245A643|nr:NAD(P)-dependent oxidoreductase [Limosilactobacillus pontis]MCX2187368.1 lactate dehydrogenase [Limosilactobacillus pontis]MCX2188728.1 lactate dehydrogenase [Limosilactobacillus pontis]